MFILPITTMKCGWRSQRCITPKKGNPANIGKSKRTNPGLRPWPQKNMPWWNVQEGHLSPQRPSAPPHPASPASTGAAARLFMEVKRVRVIRTEVRFAALQELGGAGPPPGVSGWHRWCGACRPGSACEYYVTMWERKKIDEPWLCVWIDEKDVKYSCAM